MLWRSKVLYPGQSRKYFVGISGHLFGGPPGHQGLKLGDLRHGTFCTAYSHQQISSILSLTVDPKSLRIYAGTPNGGGSAISEGFSATSLQELSAASSMKVHCIQNRIRNTIRCRQDVSSAHAQHSNTFVVDTLTLLHFLPFLKYAQNLQGQ
jgi:hypothetical protein